jgi:hypothetical protein
MIVEEINDIATELYIEINWVSSNNPL